MGSQGEGYLHARAWQQQAMEGLWLPGARDEGGYEVLPGRPSK